MSRTVGINGHYLNKLSERQRKFIITAVGRKFYDEYICRHGNHTYNISNTGGGKTQRNYWLADWLKFTENIVWISTGKTNEILPLLFLDCKVRIIIPKGAEFRISNTDLLEIEPEIIEVSDPGAAWRAVLTPSYDKSRHKVWKKITIFEFRNTISPDIRGDWMAELFSNLASLSREGQMPNIFPCAIFIDESQWILAGSRISTDTKRSKTAEMITENVLEIRSIGGRVIFSAQDHRNVTPASREQMLNALLGRGANVSPDENKAWAAACGSWTSGIKPTSTLPRDTARFVFDDGTHYPWCGWKFPKFPLLEKDRETLGKMGVTYGRKFSGSTEEEIYQTECFSELGRFQAMAIKPEIPEMAESRWNIPWDAE